MKLARKPGSTSQILQVFIQDSSSTVGAGLAGLTNASGSLTAYYHRDTDTTATAISLVTMTVGTFTSSGFKEIDATNLPGWYQFCPPNAALAASASSCAIHLKGATNMAPLPIEIDLLAQVDVASVSGTSQTARDLGASVLLSSGTGTGQLHLISGVVDLPAITTNWLTAAGLATDAAVEIAGKVLDEVNTGATHNVTNSLGKQVRLINPNSDVIYTATAPSQAGMTSTQIKLDSGASAVDNSYQFDVVSITAGTGSGQSRVVTAYVGSTKLATVDAAWGTQPDATSVFEITPSARCQVIGLTIDSLGFVTANEAASILNACAASPAPTTTAFAGSSALSSTNSWYVGSVVVFTSGALAGIARKITSYTGATRLITVTVAWPTAPTAADTFRILGRIDT